MGLDIAGLGGIADLAETIINKIFPNKMDEAEKAKAQIELQKLLQSHEENLISAQRDIIVAEMNQQDNFTKRARPTIIYCGLIFIFMVNVVFPIITWVAKEQIPTLALPDEFWWSWSGVAGLWILGRSYEKGSGKASVISGIITGNK
jgi:hypothetical protein